MFLCEYLRILVYNNYIFFKADKAQNQHLYTHGCAAGCTAGCTAGCATGQQAVPAKSSSTIFVNSFTMLAFRLTPAWCTCAVDFIMHASILSTPRCLRKFTHSELNPTNYDHAIYNNVCVCFRLRVQVSNCAYLLACGKTNTATRYQRMHAVCCHLLT